MSKLHRREWVLIAAVVLVSLSFAAYVVYHAHSHTRQSYPLLEPSLSSMSTDEFNVYQSQVKVSYRSMRTEFLSILNTTNGTYSIYFEDLRSGASVGVDEREEYLPRSLFKVPTAIAVLKAEELGEVNEDTLVTLTDAMLDNQYGDLYRKGAGYKISVMELLRLSMTESDNTANLALRSIVPFERIEEARLATGVPYPRPNVTNYTISPKSYANVLRSLYLSGYLRQPYSEYILDLLSQSQFNDLLVAGVPEDIRISHKIGEDITLGEYHDCGIVYHPQRPYIICIMSKDTTREDAERIITALSKAAYDGASRPNAHLIPNQ